MKHIVLLSVFLLSGCAVVDHLNGLSDPVAQVDAYLSRQEFSHALALIEASPAGSPEAREFAGMRSTIAQDIKEFEQQTISTALKQELEKDWPGAKHSYTEALKKLNGSQILEIKQTAMLARFQVQTTILDYEKLIAAGEELKKRIPLERRLHENDPGDITVQWTYSRTQNKARQVGLELLLAGEDTLRRKNIAMARRILPLAAELFPDPRTESALNRLTNILKKKDVRQQKIQRQRDKKQDTLAIAAFHRAMTLDDLKEASRQLTSITAATRKSRSVKQMQEQLDGAISKWVTEQVMRGDTLYRAGEYEQAQLVWDDILRLLPKHQGVLRKSERTTCIVKKLNSLKERQEIED
jgi:tetratricopeptide (TPR) repeat protein